AVHAFLARHDLLPGDPVADPRAVGGQCLITAGDDFADELVPGNDPGHHPTVPAVTAPELGGAVVTLQVTGAYAHCVDLQQQLIGFRLGNRPFFEAVITRCVHDDGLHGAWCLGHPNPSNRRRTDGPVPLSVRPCDSCPTCYRVETAAVRRA